jgi:hypothetical protein
MSTNTTGDDEDDLFIIICQPYACYDEIFHMSPNSHVARATCGHLVWLSPQSELFLLDHPDTTTSCIACKPETDKNFLVPGARDAAVVAFGPDADDVIARSNLEEWPG